MVAPATSDAIASLKNKPAPRFIRVKQADTEALTQISVPEVKRWKGKVTLILDGMPWVWIEPLDLSGNILGPRVDNSALGVAGELEPLDLPDVPTKDAQGLAALTGLLTLLLKGQDVALTRQSQAYGVVLDNNQKLLTTITTRLDTMEKHAAKNFEAMNALHNRLNMEVHKGGGDDDDLDSMVKEIVGDVARSKLGLTEGGDDD